MKNDNQFVYQLSNSKLTLELKSEQAAYLKRRNSKMEFYLNFTKKSNPVVPYFVNEKFSSYL